MKTTTAQRIASAIEDADKAITLLQHAQQKIADADLAPSSTPFNNDLWTAETTLRSLLKRMGEKLRAVKAAELAASMKRGYLGYDRLALLSQFIAGDEDDKLDKRDFLKLVAERINDDIGSA
jgi:hypothetical protein